MNLKTFSSLIATTVLLPALSFADLWVSRHGIDTNDGSEATPLRSIQRAVDLASSDESTTIYVSEGTYTIAQNTNPTYVLSVTKPVQIIATGTAENTIIDADSKRQNTYINHPEALLKGFTITKGGKNSFNISTGLTIVSGTVKDCIIEKNTTYNHCGILQSGGLVDGCIIRNNTSGSNPNGFGVRITGGTIANSEIYGHNRDTVMSTIGGGISASGANTIVTNCYIHDNNIGMASYIQQSPTPATSRGGGLYLENNAKAIDCIIANNSISGYGAGVYINNGSLLNSVVYGNTQSNSLATLTAPVHLASGLISNCVITANGSLRGASGLYQTDGICASTIIFDNGIENFTQTGGTSHDIYTSNVAFTDPESHNYKPVSAFTPNGIGLSSWEKDTSLSALFSADKTISSISDSTFTFSSQIANNIGNCTISWDFGDGTTLVGEAEPTHTYTRPGFFTVSLTVSDSQDSFTTTLNDYILVKPENVHLSPSPLDSSLIQPTTDLEVRTIKNALDLQSDSIYIYEGTYNLSMYPLILARPVTIKGVGERENIILDAKNGRYTRVAVIDHSEAKLEGVTLKGGNTSDSWCHGGGIILFDGIVTNCIIRENTSYKAPAFYQKGGILASSLITKNNCGGGNTEGEAGTIEGGLFVDNTVTQVGTIGSGTGKGTILVNGNGVVVSNCVITGNNIGITGKSNYGGGIVLRKGLVANSVITDNTANIDGGGVRIEGGIIRNCLIAGNRLNHVTSGRGAGIFQTGGLVESCTIVDNTASVQGGGYFGTGGEVVNSIIYNNAPENYAGSDFSVTYSGTTPLISGDGNISIEPSFIDAANGDYRLSPLAFDYINHGQTRPWMDGAKDLAGSARLIGSSADIGAYEYLQSADEPFLATFTATAIRGNAPFTAELSAVVTKFPLSECTFIWDFGDDTEPVTVIGDPAVSHTFTESGAFSVTLTVSHAGSESSTSATRENFLTSIPSRVYVSLSGSNTFPYNTWEKAANNLDVAFDVGSSAITVSNGTYNLVGINITRPVKIESVEGPEKTIIKKLAGSEQKNLVIVNNPGAYFDGFTLRDSSIATWEQTDGGSGLRITDGIATNCIIRNCHKYAYAACYVGGDGKLFDSTICNNTCNAVAGSGSGLAVGENGYVSGCTITNNTCGEILQTNLSFGGAGLYMVGSGAVVTNCLFENNRTVKQTGGTGGIIMTAGLLTHSVIRGNSGADIGGVNVRGGILRNCLVTKNNSYTSYANGIGPGGVYLKSGLVESCTIVNNTSINPGGGITQNGGTIQNSVIFGNTSSLECDITSGTQINCLSTVALPGEGCIGGDPLFTDPVNDDFTLSPFSPAKDAGLTQPWMDGAKDLSFLQDRIQGDSVDIGAYECDASQEIPLSAAFSIATKEKLSSDNTLFTFNAIVQGAKGEITYLWTFGDGTDEFSTTESTVTHEYLPGQYDVSLRVLDSEDGAYSETVTRVGFAIAYPKVSYVSSASTAPTFPYATIETAALTIKDALDVIENEEISILPGTYKIPDTLQILRPLKIYSQTGNRDDVTITSNDQSGRLINLDNADAVISSVTFSNALNYLYGDEGACFIKIQNGTVTNCVFQKGKNYNHGAIIIQNGLLTSSVIKENRGEHSTQNSTALTIFGGTVERCIIKDNTTYANPQATVSGEAVLLNGPTAVLRSSLIANNQGNTHGGVKVLEAQEVSNCTIAGNTALISNGGLAIYTSQGTYVNNIIWDNSAPVNPNILGDDYIYNSCAEELNPAHSNNINQDPRLKTKSGNLYMPAGNSPVIGKGRLLDWMETAKDLIGNSRLLAPTPTIGCYEIKYAGPTRLLLY